jgi:RNA polymerase-interacting CarD/CdnL/TRCF family regulator
MGFRSGDYVVHPIYGVGSIVRLEERQLAEAERRWYYVLAINKSTVWVPVHADGSTLLRAVTSNQELDRYRVVLKSRPTTLERDYKKRRFEINERLKTGSFWVLCEVVRDLTAHGWKRRMSEGEAALLLQACTNLSREWAAAAGMSVPEALHEVNALLLAGREAHAS